MDEKAKKSLLYTLSDMVSGKNALDNFLCTDAPCRLMLSDDLDELVALSQRLAAWVDGYRAAMDAMGIKEDRQDDQH